VLTAFFCLWFLLLSAVVGMHVFTLLWWTSVKQVPNFYCVSFRAVYYVVDSLAKAALRTAVRNEPLSLSHSRSGWRVTTPIRSR